MTWTEVELFEGTWLFDADRFPGFQCSAFQEDAFQTDCAAELWTDDPPETGTWTPVVIG